ncbi:hypothetical protein OSTOST_19457, partial [Ostertagia ostertagi]
MNKHLFLFFFGPPGGFAIRFLAPELIASIDAATNKPLLITSAVIASVAIAVACTHLFVASPIDPVEFRLPPQTLQERVSTNSELEKAELLLEDQIYGPESIAVNRKTKKVYTGLKTGLICELDLDGKRLADALNRGSSTTFDAAYVAPSCAKDVAKKLLAECGIRVHPKTEELYVLDAYLGLFSIDWETEKVRHFFAGGAAISDDDSAIPT